MKTVKAQPLTIEKFHRYGSYARMIDPETDATGPVNAPIVFFRDMVQADIAKTSFSVCRMEPRELVIDVGEFHNHTCEVAMPLDNDALVWVAPAGAGNTVPVDDIEVFIVPQGTLFKVHPGVWHHAAFSPNDKPVNVMIVLPERAYANDCIGVPIPVENQLKILF